MQDAPSVHTENSGLRDEASAYPYRRLGVAVDEVPPRLDAVGAGQLQQLVGPLEVVAVGQPPRSVGPPGAELHLFWQRTADWRYLQLG